MRRTRAAARERWMRFGRSGIESDEVGVDERGQDGRSTDPAEPGTPDVADEDALGSSEWRLTAVRGRRGELIETSASVTATATFADDRMMGSTGCNRYVGSCTIDGSSIHVFGVASTRRACRGPARTVEAAFLAALDRVRRYELGPGRLDLLEADGTLLLRFAAPTETSAGHAVTGAPGL